MYNKIDSQNVLVHIRTEQNTANPSYFQSQLLSPILSIFVTSLFLISISYFLSSERERERKKNIVRKEKIGMKEKKIPEKENMKGE